MRHTERKSPVLWIGTALSRGLVWGRNFNEQEQIKFPYQVSSMTRQRLGFMISHDASVAVSFKLTVFHLIFTSLWKRKFCRAFQEKIRAHCPINTNTWVFQVGKSDLKLEFHTMLRIYLKTGPEGLLSHFAHRSGQVLNSLVVKIQHKSLRPVLRKMAFRLG